MNLTFEAVLEDSPGRKWQTAFRRHWPGWKAWYLAGRAADTPSLRESERALNRHMPEFVPIWQRLVGLAGNDEDAARFLTFWRPPAYLAQCSQAVLVDHDRPVLVRNYDLDPALNEATILNSAWNRRRVIGSMEAIAGLADGINDRGLALSIAFGGRQVVGPGFGIPLITRYVLEICGDTEEAVEVLRRVPSHQSYNVTLLDRKGAHAVVLVAPDRPTIVTRELTITNHQTDVDWHERARFSRTVERKRFLDELLARPGLEPAVLIEAFLAPPLFNTEYGRGFGTLYTASYRPLDGSMTMHWRDQTPWQQSFRAFSPGRRSVWYSTAAAAASNKAEVRRPWRDWLVEGLSSESLSADQPGCLPADFAKALLRGIEGHTADDWRQFSQLWTRGKDLEEGRRPARRPHHPHPHVG
jgi:predicted choloylglycine hydrolase